MSRYAREWFMAAAFALMAVGLVWMSTLFPDDCKPDGYESIRQNYSIIIGGTMLMAGCPQPGGHR